MVGHKEDVVHQSVGIWVDHREAMLFFADASQREVVHISSNAERHPGPAGMDSSGSSEAHHSAEGDVRDRRFAGQLAHFFDAILAKLHGPQTILVLGPGEAKGELVKHLEKAPVAGRTVTVEAASRMSDNQLVKKVNEHFLGHSDRAANPHPAPGQPV